MRVLLIKTSSMGDLVHTLPALTDAMHAIPGIQFDWVVEQSFADIPLRHPAVRRVIPIALRRWRKDLFASKTRHEILALRKQLKSESYDLILDAQGLVKSAWLCLLAKGPRAGLDWASARESLASLFYQQKHTVNFYQHAVLRMRSLFAKALGYEMVGEPDFSITSLRTEAATEHPYLVFLHGTTWHSKLWPETYWMSLAHLAAKAGYRIKISGGNDEEVARAERIGQACEAVDVRPRLTIAEMTSLLANAQAAVSVDTGFGHLAAALDIPTVSIYGSTNSDYTGAIGKQSIQLAAVFPCSPCLSRECTYKQSSEVTPACYQTIPPEMVWTNILKMIAHKKK
jgi:heptosyltransferase-1